MLKLQEKAKAEAHPSPRVQVDTLTNAGEKGHVSEEANNTELQGLMNVNQMGRRKSLVSIDKKEEAGKGKIAVINMSGYVEKSSILCLSYANRNSNLQNTCLAHVHAGKKQKRSLVNQIRKRRSGKTGGYCWLRGCLLKMVRPHAMAQAEQELF